MSDDPRLVALGLQPEPDPAESVAPEEGRSRSDIARQWMQLEGGTTELIPGAVRLLDDEDNVIETRRCIPLAAGQKGHARLTEGDAPSAAWVVLGVSGDVVTALDTGRPAPFRFQAKVGEEWLSVELADTGCRL